MEKFSRTFHVNEAKTNCRINANATASLTGSTTVTASTITFNFNQDFYIVAAVVNSIGGLITCENMTVIVKE